MASVSIHLFGKPGWEIAEGSDITDSAELRAVGESIRDRTAAAADVLDKLLADGWTASMGLYDIWVGKDGLKTDDVENHLLTLGIDPKDVDVQDFDDEDDEEDWDGEEDEDVVADDEVDDDTEDMTVRT